MTIPTLVKRFTAWRPTGRCRHMPRLVRRAGLFAGTETVMVLQIEEWCDVWFAATPVSVPERLSATERATRWRDATLEDVMPTADCPLPTAEPA